MANVYTHSLTDHGENQLTYKCIVHEKNVHIMVTCWSGLYKLHLYLNHFTFPPCVLKIIVWGSGMWLLELSIKLFTTESTIAILKFQSTLLK